MHTRRSPSDAIDILRPVLDTVLDAVVAMSPEGVVIAWNEVAELTFGWTEAEAVGVSMAELIIPPQHRDAHDAGLRRYNATGEERVLGRRIEITALHKDGREFPVELSITLAPLGTGRAFLGFLRDISERRRSEERQRLLLGELDHRVKNTLAVVQSVAFQSFRQEGVPTEAWRAFESRLTALAGAHEMLTSEDWQSAPLSQLIRKAGAGCGAGESRVRIEGPDLRVPPQTAVALSMALHELCTNAVKYGALSNDSGTVTIAWSVVGGRLLLDWKEQGGPPVAAPGRRGFGTRMIERGLASELGGSATIDFAPGGVLCRIDAPLPALEG